MRFSLTLNGHWTKPQTWLAIQHLSVPDFRTNWERKEPNELRIPKNCNVDENWYQIKGRWTWPQFTPAVLNTKPIKKKHGTLKSSPRSVMQKRQLSKCMSVEITWNLIFSHRNYLTFHYPLLDIVNMSPYMGFFIVTLFKDQDAYALLTIMRNSKRDCYSEEYKLPKVLARCRHGVTHVQSVASQHYQSRSRRLVMEIFTQAIVKWARLVDRFIPRCQTCVLSRMR